MSRHDEIFKGRRTTEKEVAEAFGDCHRKFNIERERFENSIVQLLEDVEENSNPALSNRTVLTSIILKF